MADVERSWFRRGLATEDAPPRFYSDENADGDFDDATATTVCVEEAWAAWQDEVAFSEKSVAEASDLDLTVDRQDSRGPLSLRWVLTHMIEEYARHNGHADFLRERIDGAVGQ